MTGNSLEGLEESDLLSEFERQWKDYMFVAKWLHKVFNYLNDYFIKYAGLPTTNQRTFDALKSLGIEKIANKLLQSLLRHVQKYRQGEDVNWDPLRFVIDAFITIGLKGKVTIKSKANGILYWDGQKGFEEYD